MIERKDYEVSVLNSCRLTPEELLSGRHNQEILDRFRKAIDTEAPIKEALLFKRTISSFGLEKVGSRLLVLFRKAAEGLDYPISYDMDEAVYHRKDDSEDYFRPTPDSAIRYSYQIPFREAANAVIYILEREKRSMYRKEISEMFLKEMGWERSGAQIRELLDEALKDQRIKKTGNGRYLLK